MSLIEHPAAIAVTVAALLAAARQLYRLRWERAETREREALARLRIEHAERTGDFACLDVPPRRSVPAELLAARTPETQRAPARRWRGGARRTVEALRA